MNYILGTQEIGGKYQFTNDHMAMEQSKIVQDMGINQVKIRDTDPCFLDIIDNPQFDYIFMWFRSNGQNFTKTFTLEDERKEYSIVYTFVSEMLTKYNGTNKQFFLGNWEGDWYILDFMDKTQNGNKEKILNMIKWVKIRQKAVSDARKNVISTVKFYYYLEINRVIDAYKLKMDRVVNKVLPYVQIDYVSYSSYDMQEQSLETCREIVEYIKQQMKCTTDYYYYPTTNRIFIGEFGIGSVRNNYNDIKHAIDNLNIYLKYLKLGMPFIFYWAVYNNELMQDGTHKGLWLVNDKNIKTKLYHSLVEYHSLAKKYKYSTEVDFVNNFAIPTIENILSNLKAS